MKKISRLIIIFGIYFFLLLAGSSVHAVPNIISYQGKLNDQNGLPLTGSYEVTFTIYDGPQGGNVLWTETRSGAQSVNIAAGLFNVELGSIQSMSPTIFDRDDLYLGIKVGADSEMSPRQRFTSGAFSFRSEPVTPIMHHQAEVQLNIQLCNTNVVYAVSVPAGERWEISSLWEYSPYYEGIGGGIFGKPVIKIDGVVQAESAWGGGVSKPNSSPWRADASYSLFFSPQLQAKSGQVITIENSVSSVSTYTYPCGSSLSGKLKLGFFYYMKP